MVVLIIVVIVVAMLLIALLLVGLHEKNTNAVCMSRERLEGRTVLVTGGTAGMGLEIAREMAARGARVLIACPEPEEGARALLALRQAVPNNPHVLFKTLDLASFASTRSFVADILATEDRLDILINNAGVGGPSSTVTGDDLNFVMQVNYFGAFLLTLLLLPLLKKSGRPGEPSRIVNVSSILHRLGSANLSKKSIMFLFYSPYANSKLCVILFSRELTKRLKGSNVVINISDPGAVGTGIFLIVNWLVGLIVQFLAYVLFKNPWQGAQTTLHVALDKEAGEVSGEYFKNCKRTEAIKMAYDDKLAIKLWEKSIKLVKLTEQEIEECLKPI